MLYISTSLTLCNNVCIILQVYQQTFETNFSMSSSAGAIVFPLINCSILKLSYLISWYYYEHIISMCS
ncbi:rCG38812 [Rattus norvegicus]|uniref:RCG38812 n=1 Tax=Rattus norvegicus TaxID=10116 RepID=A6K9K0_RAT|nr:rCG38812 [Rattus norvegicus]